MSTRAVPVEKAGPSHGGKATNLGWLVRHGYRVPDAVVVDGPDADGLADWIKPEQAYAVRSSASVEDSEAHSFAGQFDTELGVVGLEAVQAAISRVLDSATDERLGAYLEHAGVNAAEIRMHVIVQEMVVSVASGVAFSRNPLTGLADVLIEAVPGTGDALVSGKVTPVRWVRHWGDWTQRPETTELPEVSGVRAGRPGQQGRR